MSRIDETITARKEKILALQQKQVQSHPYSYDKQQTVASVRTSLDKDVSTAGRIMAIRAHGKLWFADILDSTDSVQVMFRQGDLPDPQLQLLPLIDPGDFIGVSGKVMISKTGEVTILANSLTVLGKTLRPLPTVWNAAEDKEIRFRKRYLDMLINPKVKQTLDARWTIEKELRRYLQDEQQFVEVETPIFQPLYGGTNAKPFTTHMNALDTDFYLRLAPELYLKRLIVGGYERIFEIARNFRNEGIDQTHQPEFTMIEWYETYADYQRMMNVAEGLIKHLAKKIHGSLSLAVDSQMISLEGTWPRITMKDAISTYLSLSFDDLSDDALKTELSSRSIELVGEFNRGKALFALFDKAVAKDLINPTWIIDYPREVSPLAKQHRIDQTLAERFELYIGGKEIADGWSEITDPADQRSLFENEQQHMRDGDEDAHPLDEDFLEAMEYGMPPLGGIGMGVDRLVMFLTNTWSIKEVIAFPTLRPIRTVEQTATMSAQGKQPSTTLANEIDKSHPTNDGLSRSKDKSSVNLPPRDQTITLMEAHIHNEALRKHVRMVAAAMEAYAKQLGEDPELWFATGLLHDVDWEEYPDEHPNKAITEWLHEYPIELKNAVAAHAPERTGTHPTTTLDKYLFACDELSGFINAYSLMRPEGLAGMKANSVKKKLKDKGFAANVSRTDIQQGFELIGKPPEEHISFLIEVFQRS